MPRAGAGCSDASSGRGPPYGQLFGMQSAASNQPRIFSFFRCAVVPMLAFSSSFSSFSSSSTSLRGTINRRKRLAGWAKQATFDRDVGERPRPGKAGRQADVAGPYTRKEEEEGEGEIETDSNFPPPLVSPSVRKDETVIRLWQPGRGKKCNWLQQLLGAHQSSCFCGV